MNFIKKNRIAIIGISFIVLIGFSGCSHSVPVGHNTNNSSISDCAFTALSSTNISKTLLGVSGLLLLILGLGLLRNFYDQNNLHKSSRSITDHSSPPIPKYPPGNFLCEAFRKGIIHPQIYSFVVV